MIGICLPGGGAAGANQAGALAAIGETLALGDVDVICGSSVGSLNGALFLQDPKKLEEVWTSIKRRSVYWPIPTLWSLVWNKPLRKLLTKEISLGTLKSRTTQLLVQATRYRDSQPFVWDQFTPGFYNILQASASIPVIFPPTKIDGEWFVDGGVSDNTPLMPIFQSFQESKAKHLDLLMLHCDPQVKDKVENGSKPRLIPQCLHMIQLLLKAGQDYDTVSIVQWLDQQQNLPQHLKRSLTIREVWPTTKIGTLEFNKNVCEEGFYSTYNIMKEKLKEWNWSKR